MNHYLATIMVSYQANSREDATKTAKLLGDTALLGVHQQRNAQVELAEAALLETTLQREAQPCN